jgi:hypothetical protein
VAIYTAATSTLCARNRVDMAAVCRLFACFLLIFISTAAMHAGTNRVNLFPQLQTGQILTYHVSYHSDKQVTAESPAVSGTTPADAKVDVNALLRLEVLEVQPHGEQSTVHARTRFEVLNSDSNFKAPGFEPPAPQVQRDNPDDKFVEFNLFPDGRVENVKGLDALFPEQQQAWQEWFSRFSLGIAIPTSGVKITQKWRSQAPETSPSPIAGLRWTRESTYVRNEPCAPTTITIHGELVPSDTQLETCAVILTTATLKQQSSPQNATPDAFKLRDLRTGGTARGKNRIITYISLKTGLVVRATEEANQSMDVTIAKADGPNRVHYNIVANSHSEVLLVSETPLTHH